MRSRLALLAFVFGAVLGAFVVSAWITPEGAAPANGTQLAHVPAQTLVVLPSDKCPDAKPVPRERQPRKFNGKTYYVVPLSA